MPTRTSPGAGPLDPRFDMQGYQATFLHNLRDSGIYCLHSDGSEHVPIGSEWDTVELNTYQRDENA
eukprot:7826920-Lingulodinium_polyedra.AAC.1